MLARVVSSLRALFVYHQLDRHFIFSIDHLRPLTLSLYSNALCDDHIRCAIRSQYMQVWFTLCEKLFFMDSYFLSPAMHLFQAVRYRMWWLLPTVCLCGLLEVLGWSARLWSSINPFIVIPFQIQWVYINVQIPPWELTLWLGEE